jgi:hypothetical protein
MLRDLFFASSGGDDSVPIDESIIDEETVVCSSCGKSVKQGDDLGWSKRRSGFAVKNFCPRCKKGG